MRLPDSPANRTKPKKPTKALSTVSQTIEAKPRWETSAVYSKMSDDQIRCALDQIAAGEHPDTVAKRHGVNIGAFLYREEVDPEFAKAYAQALSAGAETGLHEAQRALIDSGDARKLADVAMWRAERVAKRYAAKSLISAEKIVIAINRGVDDDWSDE